MVLTMIMLVPVFSLKAAEENKPIVYIENFTYEGANVTIDNTDGNKIDNVSLIAASYSAGVLKDIAVSTVSVGVGDEETFTLPVFCGIGYLVKVFLWDDTEKVQPICNHVSEECREILPSDFSPSMNDFYDRLDGSTVTIPLSQAITYELFGTRALSNAIVNHNQTDTAIKNVIEGNKDIALVTYPSDENLDYAASKGVDLVIVPVVNDAFVFMVNDSNPIKSLTIQQIKDIYSGEITNWSELGGHDAEIIPLQRPSTSGSQSGMIDFMGDTEIMVPFVNSVVSTMSGLIENVTRLPESIGYSYYYYTNTMYLNNAKLLKLEGIEPSNTNVENGDYPGITQYYAVFRADEPLNSFARALTRYLLSQTGQQIAEDIGYIKLSESQIQPLLAPKSGYTPSTDKKHRADISEYYNKIAATREIRALLENVMGVDYNAAIAGAVASVAWDGTDAVKKVIDAEKDIVLCGDVYISQDILSYAEQKGVELDIIPVVKDTLVFLNYTGNFINNLSTQQIKDICAGSITNWNGVGGSNLDIKFGSYSVYNATLYLYKFLGTSDINPPNKGNNFSRLEYVLKANAAHLSTNALKIMSIDGIQPGAGGYPANVQFYAVIRKSEDENSFARELIKYILSQEGQDFAVGMGYISNN